MPISNVSPSAIANTGFAEPKQSSGGFDWEAIKTKAEADFVASQQPKKTSETKESVIAKFTDYMNKSPAERMRDQILGEMGLAEEDIAAMSPEERLKVEKKIQEVIRERMEEANRKALEQAKASEIAAKAGGVAGQAAISPDTQRGLLSAQEMKEAKKEDNSFLF